MLCFDEESQQMAEFLNVNFQEDKPVTISITQILYLEVIFLILTLKKSHVANKINLDVCMM